MLEILIEKANKYLEMYENGNSPISDEEYDYNLIIIYAFRYRVY